MKTLVVGASGATGLLVVKQLLAKGEYVKVIIRPSAYLPNSVMQNPRLSTIRADLLSLSHEQLVEYVTDCHTVVSCLGHTLSFKGVYGHPRRLVTDAVTRLCAAINRVAPKTPVKFILMNSTGCKNNQLGEKVSLLQNMVLFLLRYLVPPHADNEKAAASLPKQSQDYQSIEWVAVRPDSLIDHPHVTQYKTVPSPTRSALFDSGKTSRINVADFMCQLIQDETCWQQWRGKMPVIYNQ